MGSTNQPYEIADVALKKVLFEQEQLLNEKLEAFSGDALVGTRELLLEEIPDSVDAACSLWGNVAPAIAIELLGLVKDITDIEYANEMANAPGFNFVDSVAFVGKGTLQLRDVMKGKEHRPYVTALQGMINIGSGIALGTLTGMAIAAGTTTALFSAQIALVASMGVNLLHATEDTVRATRKIISPEYWLKDNLRQLEKVQQALAKQETRNSGRQETWQKIQQAKSPDDTLSKKERSYGWTAIRSQKKLEQLQHKKEDLIKTIQTRIKCNEKCNKYFNNNKFDPVFKAIVKDFSPTLDTSARAKTAEAAIELQSEKELDKAASSMFLTGLLFTGTLLCMLPGGQIPGTILLGAFAIGFSAKMPGLLSSIKSTIQIAMDEIPKKELTEYFNGKTASPAPAMHSP